MSDNSLDFSAKSLEIERLIMDAKAQFEMNDHKRLSQPVQYRILWFGFTHVTYQKLDFQMEESDKEYLQSVLLNFKSVVESYSDHNIEIKSDLFYIDKPTELTLNSKQGWLYLSFEAVQNYINQYNQNNKYDTVISVVQTKGEKNEERNKNCSNYNANCVILGLKLQGIEDRIGYSTFNLFKPFKGTFPLKDPSVPSLYATAVAIHEWLHQIEHLGTLLQIEFPPVHAYQGEPNFPGYQECIRDKNNYDFCEYYHNILSGRVRYTSPKSGTIKEVGMYPKMWRLITRKALHCGTYNIRSVIDNCYLTGQLEIPKLTKKEKIFNWDFRYDGHNLYNLIPSNMPHLRIDLDNGWDREGTKVKLYIKTIKGYENAQRWILTKNDDRTFCIRTAYESHRAISVDKKDSQAIIMHNDVPTDSQKWIISNSPDSRITDDQALNIINQNITQTTKMTKIDGKDAFVVDFNFGQIQGAASFAVSADGSKIFFFNQKTKKFEEKA